MATAHTKPINSMNIPGTFEVFNTRTGRWHGTHTEFKVAEASVELLNQKSNGPRYTWWCVR
ncbi:hypothetical protein AAW14_06655 [Streptomyces hygroscopicus]|uniref:hypothetical protein n=1 Tax=Streptomyces hygroscopicus TaxID=1912 RepID=UPI00223F4C02|nr:hypothetical protein [Streptomyces hygroscopicus]MCW7941709.1 hypothetical protein [Streptomyces hygroscopicus]